MCIIVSGLPGDTCDALARLASHKVSEKSGQRLVALIKRETNAALAAQGLDLFGQTPE